MFYKKRDKKAEPALGAASENAVAAVNENEIATGENGLESSSVAAQSRRQKAFRIFAAITCTLCGLLWAAFFFRPFLWTCSLSNSGLCSLQVRFSPYFRLLQP